MNLTYSTASRMTGICAQRPLIILRQWRLPRDLPRSRDLFGVGLREVTRTDPERVLEANANVSAKLRQAGTDD
jgi:hypothetical protein